MEGKEDCGMSEGKKVTVGNRNTLFGLRPTPNRFSFSFETQL